MDKMNIANHLKEQALKDRKKLWLGAACMSIINMIIVYVLVYMIRSYVVTIVVLTPLIIISFSTATILVLKLISKMEHDSFGEGMHLVMEGLPVAASLLTAKMELVYSNEGVLRLYDMKDTEEYHERFDELMPEFQPDGRRSADVLEEQARRALNKNETVTFGWWQYDQNRKLFPVQVTFASAFFEGEDHILEFIEDKRHEQEQRESEERLKTRMQAVLDASPLLCIVYDADSNIKEVNKEAEHLFGIPDKRIFAENFRDFIPKYQPDGTDSFQKSLDTIKQTMRDGHMRYEWMYQTRDGTPIPTEEIFHKITAGGKDYVIAYSRDLREYYREKEKDRMVQEQLQSMATQLDSNVAEQVTAVSESSAAIEEMLTNVQSVTNTLSRNTENVRELQEASMAGHASLGEVASDIQGIARESESLLEINSVMQNIASQTNLLSMNAAIEAAHAGELGKGFAVVADEIRKLAESSATQSKTISTVLKKIKGSIDKITVSTDKVLSKFDAIEDGVRTVAEQEGHILGAMEEQGHGSRQILQAIGKVKEVTDQVKEGAKYMAEKSMGGNHKKAS